MPIRFKSFFLWSIHEDVHLELEIFYARLDPGEGEAGSVQGDQSGAHPTASAVCKIATLVTA